MTLYRIVELNDIAERTAVIFIGITIFMEEYGLMDDMPRRMVRTMLSNSVWLVATVRFSLLAVMLFGGRLPLCCMAEEDWVLR